MIYFLLFQIIWAIQTGNPFSKEGSLVHHFLQTFQILQIAKRMVWHYICFCKKSRWTELLHQLILQIAAFMNLSKNGYWFFVWDNNGLSHETVSILPCEGSTSFSSHSLTGSCIVSIFTLHHHQQHHLASSAYSCQRLMAGFMAGGSAALDPYLGIAGWITPCCFGITRNRRDRILIDPAKGFAPLPCWLWSDT